MHELGIAHSVLEAVKTEAAGHPGKAALRVGVRVGELSGVDPAALAFGFEALTAGTEWTHLALEIETRPREHRCRQCGTTFRVAGGLLDCPACGGSWSTCVGGSELELTYLELEEP